MGKNIRDRPRRQVLLESMCAKIRRLEESVAGLTTTVQALQVQLENRVDPGRDVDVTGDAGFDQRMEECRLTQQALDAAEIERERDRIADLEFEIEKRKRERELLARYRDQWRSRAKKAEDRIAKLERELTESRGKAGFYESRCYEQLNEIAELIESHSKGAAK